MPKLSLTTLTALTMLATTIRGQYVYAAAGQQQRTAFEDPTEQQLLALVAAKRTVDPSNFGLGFGKRGGRDGGFDPKNFQMGFGKRFDPTNYQMGFGKRFDPKNVQIGFGKKRAAAAAAAVDPNNFQMSFGKRSHQNIMNSDQGGDGKKNLDPQNYGMGFGKRSSSSSSAFKSVQTKEH